MTLLLRDQENIRKGREEGKVEGKKEERSEVMNLVTSLLKVNGIMSAEGAAEFGKLVISQLPELQ